MSRPTFRQLACAIKQLLHNAFLEYRDRKAGRQLVLVQDHLSTINEGDIVLITCLRNEKFRMAAFTAHYRKLGVNHFFIIDNNSNDGLMHWVKGQADVTLWHTNASYKEANFGMLWINDILRRHARNHWCIAVDPDEFLIYPNFKTRNLAALTQFLEDDHRDCMHAILIDAYGKEALADTMLKDGDNPFVVCPYFDRDTYIQSVGWGGGTWIQGGPRMRVYFAECPHDAPALNKIPLVKWRRHFHYRMSMHDMWPLRLNKAHTPGEVSITGALFHFKLVASLRQKAEEEFDRKQHYADGREYARYRTNSNNSFYSRTSSVRWDEDCSQLIDLGLMSAGTWF